MPELTDVETLREAARLMRKRAKDCDDGPVTVSSGWADAAHILSWSPAVALAVADWLVGTSNHVAVADSLFGSLDSAVRPHDTDQALTVARTYLRIGEA